MGNKKIPKKQGLYDPGFEHDSCGVGFVCDIKGRVSNEIIQTGIDILKRLSHRGATGADPKTGDGAGILIQIPHKFLKNMFTRQNIFLPEKGHYGAGTIFLPRNPAEKLFCKNSFQKICEEEAQEIIGWREVPVNNSVIGSSARETEPSIEQVFIKRNKHIKDQLTFERKLYVIRKRIENLISSSHLIEKDAFYITNISSRTLSYKGLLMPEQVKDFFIDLSDELMESAICLVHSRYSTNTFPAWDLAQPFRFLAHNGEINTLRGNVNWMKAREILLKSELFGRDIKKLGNIIVPGGSDSAAIDNLFELLILSGRSLTQAISMLIPAAWEHNSMIAAKEKAFYKFNACIMEPWDGPAAIAFTDGTRIGAVLDRNGLRPARYLITKDDKIIMASEVGVANIAPENIKVSGRLEPGKIFFINTDEGRVIHDRELKKILASKRPYEEWLNKNIVNLEQIPQGKKKNFKKEEIFTALKAAGYTREDLKYILTPMAEEGKEPTGSMGNHTPHAVLSKKPQLIYNYFKQLFAQVTNPPIDPIREECVMSQESFLGPQQNVLEDGPEHCLKLFVEEPILSNENLQKIRNIRKKIFKTKTISILFDPDKTENFLKTIDRICAESEKAIKEKYSFIILSDRGIKKGLASLGALIATGAVHHYLIHKALRNRIAIIIESSEPREVHHFALLFGYGADCVNPYLAYEAIDYLVKTKNIKHDKKTAIKNYRHALEQGIFKILSKMGISTLRSYRGAQIFEAVGLSDEVVSKCFNGTVSRIGGASFTIIAKEAMMRHHAAYDHPAAGIEGLESGGIYQWKKDGEFQLWNPETVSMLQEAVRTKNFHQYMQFAKLINEQSPNPTTLRGIMKFKTVSAIPTEEVESAESIFKRFATGAMSFGSISKGAHETLAVAMNRIGGRSNTGEGGEDPARFVALPNGDSKRSSIKQVASGRFGVTANYLINADEIQIKIAQGAKPGEGGQLPGHKVSAIIARTRYTTPGVTLISPPPHHDIYSIEDLAELIFDLKNVNPRARISVKLVSEIGVGTVAAGVAKGHADMILISGGDGGTGASPLSSIKHAGLPWELGLSETHQTLVLNDLRSRVRLQTDGQMRTGRDVAIAALLGAEEFGFCTSTLIVMGCVMLRHCHLNNCALGVATQDDILEKRFQGKVEYVINYFEFVAKELRQIMASLGVRTIDEMIGRTDLIEINKEILPWKAKDLDISKILYKPRMPSHIKTRYIFPQDHGIDRVLDRDLIQLSEKAIKRESNVRINMPISNINRATGSMLSGEVCRLHGEGGLPENTIHCKFAGIAGQSFGAFLANGITFELEGMANDYVGKGISGGKIIIYPDRKSDYIAEENIIIGNTAFYGAISGESYIRGIAGERFCIRNSGLNAVIEGVGDHGCEYMTGGKVIILGPTGRNFGAGMSGGIAYIYDEKEQFRERCNMEMVCIEGLDSDDMTVIKKLLANHIKFTDSAIAKKISGDFNNRSGFFIKVMPLEYKKIMALKKVEEKMKVQETYDG